MTSPLLGFDEMTVGQSSKYITFNEAVKLLEALSHRAISATTAAQPAGNDGDVYIMPASPTGADWGSYSQYDIAVKRGTQWLRIVPYEGITLWINDGDYNATFDGSTWVNAITATLTSGFTSGDISLESTAPTLTLKDTDTAGGTMVSKVSYVDNTDTEIGSAGFNGSGDYEITNTVGDMIVSTNLGLGTSASHGRLTISGGTFSTPASGLGNLFSNGTSGLVIGGQGTTSDVVIVNRSGNNALTVLPTAQAAFTDGTAAAPGITFLSDTNTGVFSPAADNLAISTGGSERVRFNSSSTDFAGGITLSGNTGDILDEYEEGTWTPVVADATSGGNVATFNNNLATYTRVGRLVTIHYDVSAINTTGMTAGNQLHIRGLPFTVNSGMVFAAEGTVIADAVAFDDMMAPQALAGGTNMRFLSTLSGGTLTGVLVSDFTSGSALVAGTLIYYV